MDKIVLQKRRNELLTDYHTVVGHLQEVDYWLEQAEAGEEETSPSPPVEAATNEQRETATMPRPRRRSAS